MFLTSYDYDDHVLAWPALHFSAIDLYEIRVAPTIQYCYCVINVHTTVFTGLEEAEHTEGNPAQSQGKEKAKLLTSNTRVLFFCSRDGNLDPIQYVSTKNTHNR